jgi:Dolichyl-phosphate-mannose-protein mannosyltransferase
MGPRFLRRLLHLALPPPAGPGRSPRVAAGYQCGQESFLRASRGSPELTEVLKSECTLQCPFGKPALLLEEFKMEIPDPIAVGTPVESPGVVGRRRLILPLGIALLGLVINVIVATSMAKTTDESRHVDYGIKILRGEPDRSNFAFDSKMPVSALNALPRGVGTYLRDHGMAPGLANILRDMRAPRYATIAAAFCLCLLVFIYAESLFGRTAGLFAQLLFVMDPNIIAHSTVSTTDLYVAAATVLFLYCLRRFLLSPNTTNAALIAVTLAVAQLTKFTAAYLYIILAMALLACALYARYGREKRYRIPQRQMAILLVLTVVCFLAVINVGFVFDRPFTSLARYKFRSQAFRALQQVPGLRAVPLPLPYAYVQGFDWLSYNNSTGQSFGNIVLLNEVRGPELPRSDGFPSYYLIAYVLKEPLGMQIILLLSLVWVFWNRRSADLLAGEGLLLAAAGVFWISLSFFSKTQIGIRHILPALVIFAILSGGAFHAWKEVSSRRKLLLAGCIVWAAVSVGSYFPHMIPYFNEILTDRKMAYHFLADSNLSWGQDSWVVERFLKSNPDVILDPQQRVAGRILVNADYLAGVFPRKADYFLRIEGIQPVAHVGYGHLLFVLPARP